MAGPLSTILRPTAAEILAYLPLAAELMAAGIDDPATVESLVDEEVEPTIDLVHQDPLDVGRAAGINPDPWQAQFLQCQESEILLNCCRQSGKSTSASILAIHGAQAEPGTLQLVVSPTLRQSGEFMDSCKDVYAALEEEQPNVQVFSDRKAQSITALSMRFRNRSRIVSLPANPKTIRGFKRVRRIIIDEAAWVDDEVYYTVRPMLAISHGDLIAMSTPGGTRGWWYDAWANGGNSWRRFLVTAEDCPRYTREFLANERSKMPSWKYQAEYMCQFVDQPGQVFPTDLVLSAFGASIDPLFETEAADDSSPLSDDLNTLFDPEDLA